MADDTRRGITWRVFVLVSWCLLGMACSDDALPTEQIARVENDSTSMAQLDEAGLHASVARAMQRDASEAYDAVADGQGQYFLTNQAKRLTATADRAGLVVRAVESSSSFSLRTNAYGCEGAMREVPERDPAALKNRVLYARPELAMDEWYLNGPLGVEQGFSITKAPSCAGTKVITMETLGDVAPVLEDSDGDGQGNAVQFVEEDGQTRFVYRDLVVVDAAEKKLPAWMTVETGGIAIHFEDAGAVYPVEVDPVIMVQEAVLLAADGTSGDVFGVSVAMDGDTALVGAYGDDLLTPSGTTSASQGSAYVFVRSGTTWTQQAKLTANDGAEFDKFGASVALSGDTAIVGAPFDDVGANVDQGSAYVFVRSGTTWIQQAQISASDGSVGDQFGVSVALSGDTAIVGAPYDDDFGPSSGSAYVFMRNAGVWTALQALYPIPGQAGDGFGRSVALDGDTALVGAPYDDTGAIDGGAAYVFERFAGVWWALQAKKIGLQTGPADHFGYSVALSGDTALVGAPDSNDVGPDSGSANVLERSMGVWTWQQKLVSPNGYFGNNFGYSVALSGDTALVGAPFTHEIGTLSGSAYVFIRNGSWNYRDKLLPFPGGIGVIFGFSVAVSGDTALVGAPYDDIGATVDQGSAFVFATRKTNGEACVAITECASGSCVDGVCCDSPCAGPCQACSAQANGVLDGLCINFAEGMDPENDCNMDPTSTCQQDGVCDGNGACRLWASVTCRPNECSGNISKVSTCNGLGTCLLDPVGTDCGANGCNLATGQCFVTCTTDANCAVDAFCDIMTSQCTPKASLGTACTASAQCQSAFCVDGVCCGGACDGLCRACNADGICSAVAEDPACPKDPMNPCGFSGQCDDVGACAFAAVGTNCGDPTCTNATARSSSCDGKGVCETKDTPCGNYACNGATCKMSCNSNQDCNSGAYCDNGQCQHYTTNGSACSLDEQCLSGHCLMAADADSNAGASKICCNDACLVDSTNECGNTGQCSATGQCQVEPLGKACGSAGCSKDGHRYMRQICVSGECEPDPSVDVDCSPYQCESSTSCKSSCNADDDCVSTYACRNGQCGPKTCSADDGCLVGETCSDNTNTCIPATRASPSCTCQIPGSRPADPRWPLASLAFALVMLRRVHSRCRSSSRRMP